jgi:hypothetical protein
MPTSSSILAFGFVTPAFAVAGVLLASIPIIIHILNRRRFRTVQWAAMTFLLQAMRKNRRRLRFEQWLLLAVRCCVLGLLGLALARPVGCEQSTLATVAGRRSGLHVIVIDNSYSMAYEADRPDAKTHLDRAKQLAGQLINRLSAGGESVVLITAARPATAIIAKPSYDLEGAKTSIDRIQQSNSGTDLIGALQKAIEIAREESNQPSRSLYLFTDSTRSAWEPAQADVLAGLGKDLSTLYRIAHFNLAKTGQWNQAVLNIKPVSPLVRSQMDNEFSSLVRGFGGNSAAQLQWKLDNLPLPGGGQITPEVNTPPQTQYQAQIKDGGFHVISTSIASENRLKIDDTRWRVVDVASELKVLIVEGERGIGPLSGSGSFLQIALAPPSEDGSHVLAGQIRTNSYILPEVISDLELGNKVLGDYRAIILAGVGQISAPEADQLKAFVQQGGTILEFMGEDVNAETYNQVMLPRGLMPGMLTKRMNVSGDQKPYLFDFNPSGSLHPLLKVFANSPNTGLDTAQVFAYWQADLPQDTKAQRVLDFLPDEKGHRDPAITVQTLGQGRVVFFATSAGPTSNGTMWTTLPAKPNYVALMHELLAGNVTAGDGWVNKIVGESLEIPPTIQLTGVPVLKDPQQAEIVMDQIQAPDGRSVYHSRPLDKPGVYMLSTGNRTIPVAVNVPDDEADIRPMDAPAIKKALGDIDLLQLDDQLPPEDETHQPSNDFGWSVMAIVLALVGFECFLAMRFGHYRR